MPSPKHPGLAGGRWHELTLAEQLGNIGSEVSRACNARARGNNDRMFKAVDRALELFDLTATDDRWAGARRREILRAREYFCRVCFGDDAEVDAPDYLRRYFLQFATAARARSR